MLGGDAFITLIAILTKQYCDLYYWAQKVKSFYKLCKYVWNSHPQKIDF